ncbi:MAG: FecR domain-containing protein [Deltaproteobacteria bacterium]|nr:FecR domain-containing protein [Deltaproteobacteria bacterium]
MKRSVLLTLLLSILLLGGAFLLYQRLFETRPLVVSEEKPDAGLSAGANSHVEKGEEKSDAGSSTVGQDVEDSRNAKKLASDVGVQLAKSSGSTDGGIRGQDGGLLAVTEPASEKTFRARVQNVRGRVEARDKNNAWKPVESGAFLDENNAVRTGRSGEANLTMGSGVKVRLSPRSEFNIQELKNGLSRIELSEGHVTASVTPDGKQVLKVAAKGSDAVVQSSGGEFGVVTDGKGQVAVATTKGSVRFTSRGETVEVKAGSQSTVLKGHMGPIAPKLIPRSLLLKASPAQVKTNRSSTVVEGRTTPGSLVRVGGGVTPTDARGRFRRRVALKDGVNRVRVEVVAPSGETRTKILPPVLVDRKKPTINANMQWGEGG